MSVIRTNIPKESRPVCVKFLRFLEESEELTEEINTSVGIEVVIPSGNGSTAQSRRQHVKVMERGNDGYELVEERNGDGEIVGYHAEGTSKVGQFVQDLADEFFGHHNYICGFYEDEESSKTTIVPPNDPVE